MSPAVGAFVGFGFGLGILLIAAAWTGQLTAPTARALSTTRRRRGVDRIGLRVVLAVTAAAAAGLLTRWPVLTVAAGAAGWLAPSLFGLTARRRQLLARTEAVAMWTGQLRDLIRSSAGLNEAVHRSAGLAPAAIASEVRMLSVWSQRGDLAGALRRFAVALDDPLADTVVNALLIAERRAVSDLVGLLSALGESANANVEAQLRIGAARARIFRTGQLIGIITALFAGALLIVSRHYLAPFATVTGQVVLAGILGFVAVAVAMMVSLSKPAPAPRLLRIEDGH